ncbi:MAG: hypothetical protein V4619_09190 [Bacteroidota bacterium]
MLKIVNAEGRTLHLPADTKITVERNNPLFNDEDKFLQDVSYTFFVPFSDNSKIFFKLGHLVEKSNESTLMQGISFYAAGTTMLKGNIRYSVTDDGFDANLEPNFAAINALIKNIRLTELRMEDAEFGLSNAAFKARMLDTCVNPQKYPYIFFPVHNPRWNESGLSGSQPFVNYFDFASQAFFYNQSFGTPYIAAPFFKVTHILKEIAAYLGLTATGGYFTDPRYQNRCVYTRLSGLAGQIRPCMDYMPNMLVSDAVKFLRNREHLAIDPDLISGELRVESFKTIKDSEAVDLSAYLSTDGKQETPAQRSFTVTLKVDQQDEAFAATGEDGSSGYPPDYTLVAGDGETKQELDCGTTKLIDPADAIISDAFYPTVSQGFIWGSDTGNMPTDLAYTDENDPSTLNNWPLRLVDYAGFLPKGGKYFPCAQPHNLDEDDADFYRFLNDSKRIKPVFYMSPAMAAKLRVTGKFTHRTAGGNYVTYLAEQIAYDAGGDADRIPVKITGRVLSYEVNTKVSITPLAPPVEHEGEIVYNLGVVKAYFDPLIHGISTLTLDIVGTTGNNFTAEPIVHPTNPRGAGGVGVTIVGAYPMATDDPFELRIRQGQPKYLLYQGQRTPFTKVGDYYTVTLNWFSEPNFYRDFYTIFF